MMVSDLSIFLNELNASAGTPNTADSTRGGSLLIDAPIPMSSLPSWVPALKTMTRAQVLVPSVLEVVQRTPPTTG